MWYTSQDLLGELIGWGRPEHSRRARLTSFHIYPFNDAADLGRGRGQRAPKSRGNRLGDAQEQKMQRRVNNLRLGSILSQLVTPSLQFSFEILG